MIIGTTHVIQDEIRYRTFHLYQQQELTFKKVFINSSLRHMEFNCKNTNKRMSMVNNSKWVYKEYEISEVSKLLEYIKESENTGLSEELYGYLKELYPEEFL